MMPSKPALLLSLRITLALALATLAAQAAQAAQPVQPAKPLFKPGLWEIRNKAGGAGGGQMQAMMAAAQQQMASMDPAQRAKIEAMMSKNGVVIDNGAITAKVCITPEMAARQQMPVQQKGSCSFRFDPAVGNTVHYAYSCSKPVASGEGSATFSSPTAYTATTTTSAVQGMQPMTIDSSGRWLATECGAIAPVELPAD